MPKRKYTTDYSNANARRKQVKYQQLREAKILDAKCTLDTIHQVTFCYTIPRMIMSTASLCQSRAS